VNKNRDLEHKSPNPEINRKSEIATRKFREGWHGWDDYAAFYDWENARTLGRRDVEFWRALASRFDGPILELGCGTGRVTRPLTRAGIDVVGIDRSSAMLARGRARERRMRRTAAVKLVRGDIRDLPFRRVFPLVIAPYGILQSLVTDGDLRRTIDAVCGVLKPGGTFAIDLVPDLPAWQEYKNKVRLRGYRSRGQSHLTLIESVKQDRKRQVTIFEQDYIERREGRKRLRRHFTLTFRTVSVPRMRRRLERAGFSVDAVLGDYDGGGWDPRADVWVILATKRA
jgi:SAM-dependent methyltransferase